MRERVLDPAREEVASEPRPAQPAPSLARIMALQRSAGNQAVTRLLSRWPEEDEDSAFRKKHKKTLEQGFLLHMKRFMGDLKDWPRVKTLEEYKRAASDPDDLIVRLNADIVLATAWKQSEAAQPSALDQAKAAAADKAKEQPKKEKKEKKKEKKEPAAVSLEEFNASLPEVNPWDQALPDAMTTAEENPLMPGTIGAPTTYQFDRDVFTNPITSWDLKDHGGKNATALTVDHVRQIVTWLGGTYKRKNAVFVRRGPGSGEWTDTHQLKIIHKEVKAPGSTKKVTYHLTLKPGVYDALAEVPFAGADWTGD
jgi:hypothetical protein